MYTFYNVKKGAMTIKLSYEKKIGILEIANIYPNVNINQSGLQKGQKIFDWNNKIVFTLSPDEASKIYSIIDNDQITMNNSENYTLYHSPNQSKNRFTVFSLHKPNQYVIFLSLTKSENNEKRTNSMSLSITDKIDQIGVFKHFLKKIIDLPFKDDYFKFIHSHEFRSKYKNNNFKQNRVDDNNQLSFPQTQQPQQ